MNEQEMENVIKEVEPDCIIHAAAERFPDRVENDFEMAMKLNVNTSKNLAILASEDFC